MRYVFYPGLSMEEVAGPGNLLAHPLGAAAMRPKGTSRQVQYVLDNHQGCMLPYTEPLLAM